jgi:CubicO group peptidase (beta-lactamase class C family)
MFLILRWPRLAALTWIVAVALPFEGHAASVPSGMPAPAGTPDGLAVPLPDAAARSGRIAAIVDDPAALELFIDGVVLPLMKNHSSPSGVVVIAHRDRLVFSKGYGFQNVAKQVPVDPARTLFRPGSVSKLFTWVAVMQLVEQGKLDLDEDVNTYLGTFRIRDTFDEPITLRHILTHTTGFEDGAFGYLIIDDPARIMPLEEAMRRYEPARVNPPGKQTAYSNYATALAGLIVANVSGLSFNDYIRQNIFEPLGMNSSTFEEPLPMALADRMAESYTLEAGGFVAKPFEIIANFGPAGAQSATATDMIRFAQAILNGGELDGRRILRPETVEQMLTRSFSHDDRLMGMLLGFYEDDYEGVRVVGHGGDTRYFHSFLGIDRDNELTYFVSFGADGGATVRSSILPAFYRHFFPRSEAPLVPPAGFGARAGRYAGSYGFWRSNFSLLEKALGLTTTLKVSPGPDDTLVIGYAGQAKQYVEIGDRLFRERSPDVSLRPGISPRLVAFQENADGEITGFVMQGLPFMSLRKLPLVATQTFNFALLGVSLVVLLGVLLRRFYQRAAIRQLPAEERLAHNALLSAAVANWLVVISGAIVISIVADEIFGRIPLLFKLWLVLPIVATLAGAYAAYGCFKVWKGRLLAGGWARLRYSFAVAAALFMCWFYSYWNILGFQYRT